MGTPTVPQVKAWDPDVLNTQAGEWLQKAKTLGDTLDAAARSVDGSHHYWIGDAGDSMRDRHDEIHGDAKKVKTALENGATAARNGATAIQAAKTTLLSKVSDAEGAHFTVGDTGEVKVSTDMLLILKLTGQDSSSTSTLLASLEHRAEEYQKAIQAALTDCGTADDNAMTAVNNAFANLTTTQIQQPTTDQLDQLTADQARQDLQAVKDGTADDAALARIRMATTLSDYDKQELNDGNSVGLAQYPYLQAFTQGMNDMSSDDISQLGSKLKGNEPDQVRSAIANDFRIVSDPQVHSLDGKSTGGMSQLPKNVQKILTENPSVLTGTATSPVPYPVPDQPNYDALHDADSMRALGQLMSKGDLSIQGSDINRAMIKQGAEIAALNPSADLIKSQTGSLANTFLQDASGDHTAVHDALVNPHGVMDVTCTPGGHYDPNSHVLDILQHQWSPDQHGAENMFKYIGDDAGAANQFQQQRAGESAQSLATIIAHNEATLSHDVPGYGGHVSFGELNRGLSQVVAKSLEPYIPNLAGVTDKELLVNHYCGNLDTASGTDNSVTVDGTQLNHTPGDLSNLFKVIDSNPQAATEFNTAAAHLAGQLDFAYGAGHHDAAYEQGQLTGAMKNGLADELSTLIKIDHQNTVDHDTSAYNQKAEIADIVTGIVNGAGIEGPAGGVVSTAAWILDPIIKAQIPSPDTYGIDHTTTHWDKDLGPTSHIDANNTFLQDANIINGYNSVHHDTFDQFNNHQYNGRTYQFFDSQGRPNMGVIEHNRDAFDDAKKSIIGQNFFNDYRDNQRAGLTNPAITPQKDGPK
ncbi:WXG100 family type VII secretion target [Nocardia sp. NPDC004860]|uniref:WXG100 family type VII secretion target n=1 Tax=Nocardia sp. NPDC004860 TaxID=3154557 RepID=UPI0033A643AA